MTGKPSYEELEQKVRDLVQMLQECEQTEERLRNEKGLTKIALDSQLDTFFLFDPATGKTILWNRAFNDITGYTDEEIAGMVAPDSYYSPEDLKRANIFIQKVLKKGIGTIELELICKDGLKVPTEYKVSVVKNEEGKPEYLISIGRDIIERKQAEEAILQANEEWERTFDAVPDLIALLDDKYRINRVNRAMADRLGVSPDGLVGLTCYKKIHGAKEPPPFCPHAELLEDGQRHIKEFHEERLGGDFLVSVSPMHDAEGRLIGSVHLAHDITERKKAEEKLEILSSAVEQSYNSIAILDLEGKTEYANPKLLEAYGLNPEEVIGKNWRSFISEYSTLKEDFQEITDTVLREKRPWKGEVRDRNRNGETIWRDAAIFPVKNKKGDIVRAVYISEDITERKQAEEILRESEQKLKEAQKIGKMGHWEFDLETQKSTWSDMIYEFHGRDPNKGPSEFSEDLKLYDPQDSKRMQELVLRAIETGQSVQMDFRANYPSGRVAYYSSTFHPIKDKTGRVTKVKGTQQDITERKLAEEALEEQAQNLEESNAALRVLLRHRDLDRKEFEDKVVFNVKELVFPYVEKLQTNQLNKKQMVYLDIIKSNLDDIISPFLHQLSSKYSDLTAAEIKVANLVKDGKTTKEIADLLNSSIGTVNFHRNNLRKKLGLRHKKTNLRAHLLSLT